MVSLLHAGLFGVGGYVVGIASWHDFNSEALHLGPLVFNGTGNLLISLPLAFASPSVRMMITCAAPERPLALRSLTAAERAPA